MTGDIPAVDGDRPLRADARRNRDQILGAARDVFVEHGANAPLELIAKRAGTGIATLYRRFPDRAALMRAVVLQAWRRTEEIATSAADEEPDPFRALIHYMHSALDIRVAAVVPALLAEIAELDDVEMQTARGRAAQRVQALIDGAHRSGALRPDVTFADIGLLVVRLSRPLPGSMSRELNDELAHRHLQLLVHGLRAEPDGDVKIQGPALSLEELNRSGPLAPPR
ncbi:TetR/AcrR family transcriptional regulator [Labedaea rhizosphaerae]|uniref:TetR family transcriptional regulator n=1 Tax=Labedaea rhizosphaerae TaxID=598644 RepID=A0A4R6SBG4_LABRH|nr:TetR/AcrR family transcriptional regulator [Labedaea rhizosphaerae]TDP96346.1 TetR family transcriptional regulator [Labedaea rhizosphaerae]